MYCSARQFQVVLILSVGFLLCYNYLALFVDVQRFFKNDDEQTSVFVRTEERSVLRDDSSTALDYESSLSYMILVYKFGPFLERRHIKRFSKHRFSPWENCPVKSCVLSYNDDDLDLADAVIFHLHLTRSVDEIPIRANYDQRWIFLTDESPLNTFLYRNQNISDYDGLFNWSMTYRSDSDVPVPYGRTVFLGPNHVDGPPLIPKKTKLLVIMGSNCGGRNGRWNYVTKLKKLLGDEFDILGRCHDGNTTACPGHFDQDCPLLESYKFYLSFENSNCREYMTEKVFWNAYSKFAVPVIMGPSKYDCKRLLPPASYLHVVDFAGPPALADYLKYLHRHDDEYFKFHEWRRSYRVLNEHGYFGSPSFHYCKVCEALHFDNGSRKVYDDLNSFWNGETDCDIKD